MDKISLSVKFVVLATLIALATIGALIFLGSSQSSILVKLIVIFSSLSFVLLILYITSKTRDNLNYFKNKAVEFTSGNLEQPIDKKLTSEFEETAKTLEKMRTVLREEIATLQDQRGQAEAVIFNVGEGVFAVNLKGEIIIFNQIAEKTVGITKDLVLGQPYHQILQFYNSKTKTSYGRFINEVLLEGKATTLPSDTVIITSHRAEIPVAVNSSPIKNQKGIITGAIVVFRDITHEKEIEEIRTDLISIASHQLRTPLSEIKGLVSLLEDNIAGSLNIKQLEYLKLLGIANERMINLVNDLLNVSRIEQGRLQLNFQKVDLGILVSEVKQSLTVRVAEKKQTLNLSVDQALPSVLADPDKTREIISNLVENALKYTWEGGTIQVRVTADATSCWVLVADNGVGIPKDKQKDLFQKFSRIENPLSKTITGSGLGLYTVKQLVEKQNGRIWLSSVEGKGSTFGFSLPKVK
ncbi:MAG TPA: ATP-binding protein [Candidatus Saccharimonadales bacterium]|nr:ATP-binding protein [Candidatus Saccharimonadales bacterium]